MTDRPKYYWDACAWIALIQQEPTRFDELSYVIEEARKGNVEIWTSNFTLAEVFKRPCDGKQKGIAAIEDAAFEDFIVQEFVTRVQVDFDVGVLARRLLRKFPEIGKPQDGIHLATALLNNVDELHTYDRKDLISLSGRIDRRDGVKLKICAPPQRPTPAQPEKTPMERYLDELVEARLQGKENKAPEIKI